MDLPTTIIQLMVSMTTMVIVALPVASNSDKKMLVQFITTFPDMCM